MGHWGRKLVALWFIGLLVITGCKKVEDDGDTDDSESPPVGTVDDDAGFYAIYRQSDKYTYRIHKGLSTTTAECKADPSDTAAAADKFIDCYLEAEELDLYFHGVSLQYNVPSTACSYVRFTPYWYWNYEPGVGATSLRVDTDSAGNIGKDNNDDGTVDVAADEITCSFDYSLNSGPNCCVGTYDLVQRNWVPNDTDPTKGDYASTTAQDVPWGGDPSQCISGPAVDTQPKNKYNFPLSDAFYVEGTGINKEYKIEAPINNGRNELVYIANYFDVADHGAATPVSLTSKTLAGRVYPVFPYYQIECWDRAQELKARIRIHIRKWDTVEAFNQLDTDPTAHSNGIALKEGATTPLDTEPISDRYDWKDFRQFTGGNEYPFGND